MEKKIFLKTKRKKWKTKSKMFENEKLKKYQLKSHFETIKEQKESNAMYK